MKHKYIEERFNRYFIFGEHENGMVDLADSNNMTLATVSREHADAIINDRDKIVDMLCEMACAFEKDSPNGFDKFWCGTGD